MEGYMKLQTVLPIALAFTLTGCGTVNTVIRGDAVASHNLKESESYCESIPRVYSGVSYDFCILHGSPAPGLTLQASNSVPDIFFDFVISGVLDTLVLPYTIYRQSNDGNIEIQ
jgi:uncharacterized protein YceK